jgi:hypothetical protein
MSTNYMYVYYNNYNPVRPSDGASKDADTIQNISEMAFKDFFKAVTLSRNIFIGEQILKEIGEECGEEGWDGYNAEPIKKEALLEAMKLLIILPSTIPLPKILPEPSGGITFRWRSGIKSLLMAVKGNRHINYATISGPDKSHGKIYFSDFMPKKLPELIFESSLSNEHKVR